MRKMSVNLRKCRVKPFKFKKMSGEIVKVRNIETKDVTIKKMSVNNRNFDRMSGKTVKMK